MLRLLNVPEINNLLPEPPRAKELDAVQENMAAVSGIPLKAFPRQDHMAHLEVHLRFILNPVFGAGPALPGTALMPILQHCTEHLMGIYPQLIAQGQAHAMASGKMLPDTPMDRQFAVGSAFTDQEAQVLQPILQMLQMAQQLVQKKMPQPPMDPQAQVAMQVAQLEDARAKAESAAKLKLEEQKQQGLAMREAAEFEMKQSAQQHMQRMEEMKLSMESRYDELSRQVELAKNDADNRQHQMTELLKNRDDNQTQVIIAQMKAELDSMRQAQESFHQNMASTVPQQDDSAMKEMQRLLGEIKDAKTNEALGTVMQGLQATISSLNRPKMIIEDANGKPIGVQ